MFKHLVTRCTMFLNIVNILKLQNRLKVLHLFLTVFVKVASIYKFGFSVMVFVCLFVSNKRQNGWTDRAQIFCRTSHDHREGLWMIKISNICLHQNSIFSKFLKILKSRKFFAKICELFLFRFTMYTKRTCSHVI